MTTTFEVDDMTRGHCASTITRAVQALDAGADVRIDLAAHRVRIESARADALGLANAIAEAGYSAVAV